jgi:hypothetical protein
MDYQKHIQWLLHSFSPSLPGSFTSSILHFPAPILLPSQDGSAGVAVSSEDEEEDGMGGNNVGRDAKGRKKADRPEVGKKEGLELKASQEDSRRQKAELELLMMDDVALRYELHCHYK